MSESSTSSTSAAWTRAERLSVALTLPLGAVEEAERPAALISPPTRSAGWPRR